MIPEFEKGESHDKQRRINGAKSFSDANMAQSIRSPKYPWNGPPLLPDQQLLHYLTSTHPLLNRIPRISPQLMNRGPHLVNLQN